MKVLFVSSLALFEETRFGGAKRLHYLAKELERNTDLGIICFDGSREWPGQRPFPQSFRRQLFLPMPPLPRGPARLAFLPGIAGVIDRHARDISAFLGEGGFDAVVLAFPIALAFLDRDWKVPLGKRIYIEDDLILERYRIGGGEGGLVRRLLHRMRYRQCQGFFSRHTPRLDRFVCISSEEEAVVRRHFPGVATCILKYGLPLEEYPLLPPPPDPRVLGFIGNFGHTPNLDALRWILEDLFPRLRASNRALRLIVAGKRFPPELKPLCDSARGITLLGDVGDLKEFYSGIGIFFNAIRQGRGLRTKVVEAAAFGRPILSTRLGAEGLGALEIRPCETAEEFLEAGRDLEDEAAYRGTVARNRAAVEREFSVHSVGRQMIGFLGETIGKAD
jgi:glycosyltransferase involved in cell wall biosynthesis